MTTKTIQMYRTNLDGSETTLYPLTEAKYVTMDDGTTIEEALTNSDSSKYSPVIESSKAMFKVGEGDSVDLSESAIDGAYNSCVLKGKTMVNCIQEPSSQDVVLPYEFEEGQYVTINDTKESGALGVELKGQTLVNLLAYNIISKSSNTTFVKNGDTIVCENTVEAGWSQVNLGFAQQLKPLTKYLIKWDSVTWNNENFIPSTSFISLREMNTNISCSTWVNGQNYMIGTTLEDISNMAIRIHTTVSNSLTNTVTVKGLEVFEYQDGMENWDIPYFEGMTSCKMPILKTVGKNLFNYKNYNLKVNEGQNPQEIIVDEQGLSFNVDTASWKSLWYDLYLESGEKYTLSYNTNLLRCFIFKSKVNTYVSNELVADTTVTNATEDKIQKVTKTFTAPSTGFIRVRLVSEQKVGNHILQNFQIEKSSSVTTYEPHKSSILSLPEEVVLRSLPNGVCDTFNMRTNVYTQRVYETTITGTEGWVQYDVSNTNRQETIAFSANLGLREIFDNEETYSKLGGIVCDKLNHINSVWGTNKDIEGISADQRNVIVQIKKTRLVSEDVAGFKTWLTSNNLKVGIQLKVPTITKINLSSTLKSWNATTHIYSETPENTLYPILSHSNPTYPVILKPSTKYSIVANSYSNGHTNSAINFNLGGATASTTVGNRVTTITTPSTLTSEELVMSGRGNKLNNVMIIEGDVVGDEPYFEGICDCKTPILLNVGKNLAKLTRSYTSLGLTFKVIDDTLYVDGTAEKIIDYYLTVNNCENSKMLNSLEVGTMVTLSNSLGLRNYFGVWRNGTTDDSWFANTMTIQNGDNNIRCFIRFEQGSTYNNQAIKIQLEATQNPTTYEPYKSNTTTFEQKDDKTIVLRSLPSGVCDTLNVETGEYVQRIGEVVLDGSDSTHVWNLNGDWSMGDVAVFWSSNIVKMTGNSILCDKFPSLHKNELILNNVATKEAIRYGVTSVQIFIAKNKLATPDVAGFKQWLSQNPIVVQYELETPTVKTIDIQGFPYAYKDGHVQLSSGSIEQSLTPKVEYSLVANRNGQIEANTKSIRRHQDKLDDFEALMLTQMIQTHYEKTLLQFDFEMQMMALGGE